MADQDDLDREEVALAKARGVRLKQAREKAGLTQTQFGARVGRDKGTIWRYETARSKIPSETLMLMADELGVSPTWLMSGITEVPATTVHERFASYMLARPATAQTPTEALQEFLATPFAATISTQERDLLEIYQRSGLVGEPSAASMQFLVMAMREEQKAT